MLKSSDLMTEHLFFYLAFDCDHFLNLEWAQSSIIGAFSFFPPHNDSTFLFPHFSFPILSVLFLTENMKQLSFLFLFACFFLCVSLGSTVSLSCEYGFYSPQVLFFLFLS